MTNIPTPHIEAKSPDEIASTVLMPGDPLRAKFIADTYLENVTCFNQVRGMLGFTGTYHGKRVSVMGSGMGIPSSMIYYHELYAFYQVDTIIRIGTAGSMQEFIKLKDIVVATASISDSAINKGKFGNFEFCPTPDFDLVLGCYELAKKMGITCHFGPVVSGDQFYTEPSDDDNKLAKYGCLVGEMESYGLYTQARSLQKRALAMFTVSDSMLEHSADSSKDREQGYTQMMELALELAPQ
ncbi:MAG: purine-nucleoside phosphorylase [Erysipelotrichaceae bacterium]|jgi:purine-nucleoside phosphorylase|nr:purine-nucleoside phosphorylase [Erysipelotrichaceae bacterium]